LVAIMNTRILLGSLALVSALGLFLSAASSPSQAKPAAAPNPSGKYTVDTVHSTVLFRVKHMNASWAFGRFNQVTGELSLNTASPEKSSVTVTIATDSVDTGAPKREAALKGLEVFDVVQFPEATFVSKSVKKSGEGKYAVDGEITFRGIKKPLSVEFEQVGFSDTKMGVRIGFYGTFMLKRSDFGMKVVPEQLGDEVYVTVSLEGTQTEPAGK
jgi:polyisoprenoid-binding protein YceI